MTETAAPATIVYGAHDTLSVFGLPGGATGTVIFTAPGATLCTATLSATSCQTAISLGAGLYAVTATYSGDSTYSGTTATGASFRVTKATPSFTETTSPTSVAYGVPITLTASGLPAAASGTVRFLSGIGTLCTATIPILSCTTSTSLAQGQYGVGAIYSGDANFNAVFSISSQSFTVNKVATSMTESAAPSSVAFGSVVTLSTTGISVAATGTLRFLSGTLSGPLLCGVTLPVTSCQTSATLAPGTYAVTADYSGDVNFGNAFAFGASFTVSKVATSMSESASPLSIAFGGLDTLTAAGLPGDATGTVTFSSSGSGTLCTAVLPATSCQTSNALAPGTYVVIATYSGNSYYSGTADASARFTVVQADVVITESATPVTIAYGTQDTLAVAGLPTGATGTVTFMSGAATLCIASATPASCLTSTTLAAGSYSITAIYSGDSNYNGATDGGASLTVSRAATSMTESAAPASVPYGSAATLSLSGLPVAASGTVTFASSALTLCTATLPVLSCATPVTLDAGAFAVTATYSGDANHSGTIATGAAFSVVKAATTLNVSISRSLVVSGSTVTVSASGLPPGAAGTVTFTVNGVVICTATLPATSCTGQINLAQGHYEVDASYSGDGNYAGSAVVGSGAQGTFSVLAASITSPDTGTGLGGWRLALAELLLVMGVSLAALTGVVWRKRPTV